MEYFFITLAAFAASGLTFFSGFGLGTLLLPVFALFCPLQVAVALTAVVHLLNNLFKLALVGKEAHRGIVLQFGLPALFAAWVGAQLLFWLGDLDPLLRYSIGKKEAVVTPVKLIIAFLMIFFAWMETAPAFKNFSLEKKYLPLGGLMSGFFGGFTGHQGAFRSVFLLKAGLSKESFIGTGVAIAVLVDLTRISVYGSHFHEAGIQSRVPLLTLAAGAAFLGAWLGNQLIRKVTYQTVQTVVTVLLILIALGIGSGLI